MPRPGASEFVSEWRRFERMGAPFDADLLRAAEVAPGARVIDVGCGAGGTTLSLAAAVGSSGRVLAIDKDPEATRLARWRVAQLRDRVLAVDKDPEATRLARWRVAQLRDRVRVVNADAATFRYPLGDATAIVSRFGTLHFDEPVVAFAHLGAALAADGRLAITTWKRFEDNTWARLPFEVVSRHVQLPRQAVVGGAFSFSDAERVRSVLSDAGYRDIELRDAERDLWVGSTPEDVVDFFMRTDGARLARAVTPEVMARIGSELAEALRDHAGDDGVRLPSAARIISATR